MIPDAHYHLYFINNTDQDLFVATEEYETSLVKAHSADSVCGLVPVNKMEELFGLGPKNYDIPEETYEIEVFDADRPENLSWFDYRKQYRIWYSILTLNDFKRLDWRIQFPPTKDMKKITMDPSYEIIIAQ